MCNKVLYTILPYPLVVYSVQAHGDPVAHLVYIRVGCTTKALAASLVPLLEDIAHPDFQQVATYPPKVLLDLVWTRK